MPNMNYAAQYGRELANAYPYLSYYGDLWNQGESVRFRPLRGKTVYIPMMSTTGARAVNRDRIDGVFTRNFDLDWQACDMAMDREWDTLVDPMDMDQTNEVATIANITRTFNEFQKIPEQDAYMSSKLAAFAGQFGGSDSTALTAANILDKWDDALAYMTDQRVNRDRVRCKVIPSVYKLLKQAAGITRFIEVTNGIQAVDRNIAKLDGVLIQEIPSDMMKSAYDFSTGWAVASGATQIAMLFYDTMAIAAPIVYDVSMMSDPTAQSKGKYLYYERYYYDVFALIQRGAGLFAFQNAPALGVLTVTSVAGPATGQTILAASGAGIGSAGMVGANLEAYYTSGASAVTLTYGAALPSGSWTKASILPVTATIATGQVATIALVNKATGHVVAGGSATVVAAS